MFFAFNQLFISKLSFQPIMMKTLASVFFACFLSGALLAQDNKTLVKTFDTSNSTAVKFDFKSKEIKTETWSGAGIRIELEITANMPTQIMDELVKAGRYSLQGTAEGDMFVVSAPNLGKSVTIKGTDLDEQITVRVKTADRYYVQSNVLEKAINDSWVARDGSEAAKLKEMKKFGQNIEVDVIVKSTLAKQPAKMQLKRGDILIGGEPIGIE